MPTTVIYNPSDPIPFDLYNAVPTFSGDFLENVYGSWAYVAQGDDYPTFGVIVEVSHASTYAVPGWRVQGVPITVTYTPFDGDVTLDVLPATSAETDSNGEGVIAFGLTGAGGSGSIKILVGVYFIYFTVHLLEVGEDPPTVPPPAPPPPVTPDPDAPGGSSPLVSRGNIAYDQLRASSRKGTGPKVQMAAAEYVPGHVLVYDADGNAVDGGSGSGTGGGIGGGGVPATRRINTTSPLTGGGDLSGDLTLGITAGEVSVVEVPTGTLDGSNATFTLSNPPTSLLLFLNGVHQTLAIDYAISGATITYTVAPKASDVHTASYTH